MLTSACNLAAGKVQRVAKRNSCVGSAVAVAEHFGVSVQWMIRMEKLEAAPLSTVGVPR